MEVFDSPASLGLPLSAILMTTYTGWSQPRFIGITTVCHSDDYVYWLIAAPLHWDYHCLPFWWLRILADRSPASLGLPLSAILMTTYTGWSQPRFIGIATVCHSDDYVYWLIAAPLHWDCRCLPFWWLRILADRSPASLGLPLSAILMTTYTGWSQPRFIGIAAVCHSDDYVYWLIAAPLHWDCRCLPFWWLRILADRSPASLGLPLSAILMTTYTGWSLPSIQQQALETEPSRKPIIAHCTSKQNVSNSYIVWAFFMPIGIWKQRSYEHLHKKCICFILLAVGPVICKNLPVQRVLSATVCRPVSFAVTALQDVSALWEWMTNFLLS